MPDSLATTVTMPPKPALAGMVANKRYMLGIVVDGAGAYVPELVEVVPNALLTFGVGGVPLVKPAADVVHAVQLAEAIAANPGPTGPQGVAGPQGSTGAAGAGGVTGAQGEVGPQGNTGAAGAVGEAGPQGPIGNTGTTGPQGNAGAAGATGDAGPQGATGSQGVAGNAGAQGTIGNTGSAGPQGTQGATGTTGSQGIQGATGPAGAQGVPGIGCYTLLVQALTSSPADAVTIYFGSNPRAPVTAAATSKVFIPKTGTIKRADIYCYSGTAGSAEAWSISIRKNNTTDTLVASVAAATQERTFSNAALNIAVVAGDYIEIKSVNPTWATNPLTTTFGGSIYIEA